MERLFIAVRALTFGSVFVWLWSAVALRARRFDVGFGVRLPAWIVPAGVAVLVCGGTLAAACVVLFVVRGRGTPAPFDAPRTFVALGPYRVVRNPMYVGGWLALLGFALVERSPAMIAFSAVWLALAHMFVVTYEERALASRFGASYADYCRRVPRWIPAPRSTRGARA